MGVQGLLGEIAGDEHESCVFGGMTEILQKGLSSPDETKKGGGRTISREILGIFAGNFLVPECS